MARIPEYSGDIFQAPEGSVIIHACNCVGAWGAGFALALREKFPAAFEIYRQKCTAPENNRDKQSLLGTALLIEPQHDDVTVSGSYWIACLFTSFHYGAKKDKPANVLESTRLSLASLKQQIERAEACYEGLRLRDKLWTVRINAKAFRTPWDDSRLLLVQSGLDIGVINNLGIMSAADKAKTIKSMTANGSDPSASPPFESTKKDGEEGADAASSRNGNAEMIK